MRIFKTLLPILPALIGPGLLPAQSPVSEPAPAPAQDSIVSPAPATPPAAPSAAPQPAPDAAAIPTPGVMTPDETAPPPAPQPHDIAASVMGPAKPKLNALAEAPNWEALKELNGLITLAEFEEAFADVYSDGSNLPKPWRVMGNTLVVDTSPGKPPVAIQFLNEGEEPKKSPRYWRTAAELPLLKKGDPILKGVHISLDPGHIGGAYAQLEERWLTMNGGGAVMEGNIVLAVANLIKPRLEALGAQVTLVRNQEAPVTTAKPQDLIPLARQILLEAGIPNPPETYRDRLDEARILSVQWQSEKLFYRVSEIRARAHKVNVDLRPDMVLCLHLNAEAWGDPQKPEFVDKNHLHLLINGCYGADELQYEDTRYEMLHRLFTKTHLPELAMSGPVASELAVTTQLPPFVYLTKNARRVSDNPYVYARNLLASRMYQCPVLYYEPYVMNHEETYKRLLLGHFIGRTLLDHELVTSPMEDYARGVVNGLVKYFSEVRPLPES